MCELSSGTSIYLPLDDDMAVLEGGKEYTLVVDHQDTLQFFMRATAAETDVASRLRFAAQVRDVEPFRAPRQCPATSLSLSLLFQADKQATSAIRRSGRSLPPLDRSKSPIWVLQNRAYTLTSASRAQLRTTARIIPVSVRAPCSHACATGRTSSGACGPRVGRRAEIVLGTKRLRAFALHTLVLTPCV